jgi:hypothetical protein
MSEHSVIIRFTYASEDQEPLFALGDALSIAIDGAGAGEYDGHEMALIDPTDAFLFMYGPDADRIFEAVRRVVEGSPLLRGAVATLRYGSPDEIDADEQRIVIGQ